MEPSASRHARARGFTRMVGGVDARAIDALIALVLTVAALATVIGRLGTDDAFRPDDLLGTALALMQTAPVTLRRAAPLGVLVVIRRPRRHQRRCRRALRARLPDRGTGQVWPLVALYGAASLTDNRKGVVAAAVSPAAVAAFFATNRGHWSSPNVASTSATWAAAWLARTFVRLRREQAEAAGARAASLEREHDARAREAVADERARMARELHDIVGHALNVVVIQAAGARRVFDAKPDVVRDALASIESSGRAALFDMERMLGMLRATEGNDGAPCVWFYPTRTPKAPLRRHHDLSKRPPSPATMSSGSSGASFEAAAGKAYASPTRLARRGRAAASESVR